MTAEELLAALELLPHHARVQRMVELGRMAAGDASVTAMLAAFEQGEFYERWLALQSYYGSRDGAQVLRALSDPSRLIRAGAIKLAALLCNDAQAQEALSLLTIDQCHRLLLRLFKRHRQTPIDAFLTTLAASGDSRLLLFLPFGSPAIFKQYLEQVLPTAGQIDYRRLARFHPTLVSAALLQRAAETTQLDQRLIWLANVVLPELADRLPDEALALVRSLMSHVSLAALDLAQLALRRPNEVADLVLESDTQPRADFARVAHRLHPERLHDLIERGLLANPEHWLKRLKPDQRASAYAIARLGWRDADGCLPVMVVGLLPAALREQEGRRHQTLPTLATRPQQRLPYAAFLPWDEVLAALDPFIRHPDPDLRGVALAALVAATRFHRDRQSDLLALLHVRRNEQDPVRQSMLSALANLPPGRWQPEHLDGLGHVIRDALDAADLSHATASAIERLVAALLPFHPTWSAAWLATLAQERGALNLPQVERRLSDKDVGRLAPALLPVLHSWETRERERHLITIAWCFGKRLKVFDALVEIIERVLQETRTAWIPSYALAILARHRPERLADLIPSLIAQDASWVTQQTVYEYLHRKRQDLLTPFLGQTAYKGRFSTGKTRFVLPLLDGFHRWTPTQQALFAETLTQVTRDEKRDTPALWTVIEQLGALPAIPPTRLIALAHVNAKLTVRDRALRSLGRLDAGQGIPTLLEAMGDERARIAIYALRGALLEMPTARAAEVLRGVPLDKVTVAKEVVRLLGELPGEAGYLDLLAMEARDLHRDVRVALLRAFWDHLEQEKTWPILERAARSADPAIAAGVVRIPADRLSPGAQRRLAALIALLLAHPDPKVRLDTLQRVAQLPLTDVEQALVSPLFSALESPLPDECMAAADAIFTTYVGRDAALIANAIERIINHRRAIVTVSHVLQKAIWQSRSQMLPTARAVLAALRADPLTAAIQANLAIIALPWEDVLDILSNLAASNTLHSEALMAAVQAIQSAARRPDAAGLARLEETLRQNDDERLRRLGLAALVALAEPPRGWDQGRLALLQAYRADSAALVAAAAQFTLPLEETNLA
ncbi:MAG TPA: hypothetical protein VKT82_16545 [Ktedonobacterales bacterium]|nr:hypothetical protein [Ktedonobacterales bacterium]